MLVNLCAHKRSYYEYYQKIMRMRIERYIRERAWQLTFNNQNQQKTVVLA